jgi:hypothetical protein
MVLRFMGTALTLPHAYEITMLYVCVPFRCFNQLTEFHEKRYGRYAIGGQSNLVH